MQFSYNNDNSLITSSFHNATGKMPYTLTNDYLFRATLQHSNEALKGLICSILGLKPEEIISVEITNPIELGKSIDAKDFVLDIRALLNNRTSINIEMQVLNLGDWPERSLGYLCRSFDTLNRGQNYIDTKPVIQICFLDFTLFQEYPEFFSNYMFINAKNNVIYSDKLKLSVVDLTKIDIATEEDKLRGIDYWARLFKATTWEEIKMLSSNNDSLTEAAKTAYQLSAEETIRMQCEAREDYYRHQRYIQSKLERLEHLELKEKEMEIKAQEFETMSQEFEVKAQEFETMSQEFEEIKIELSLKDAEIARLTAELNRLKNK